MRRDRTKLYSGEPARDPTRKSFPEIERPTRGWDRVHVNLAVSFGIIAILMGLFLYGLRNLPQQLQETGCMGRLRQIGQVLTMYNTDYDDDPPPGQFPAALYAYVRSAEGQSEADRQEDREAQRILGWRESVPREATRLFICPADRRPGSTNSYLLVDHHLFPLQSLKISESLQPWVVDEVFHRSHTLLLNRDGHTEAMDKETYLRSVRPLFNIRQWGEGWAGPGPAAPAAKQR